MTHEPSCSLHSLDRLAIDDHVDSVTALDYETPPKDAQVACGAKRHATVEKVDVVRRIERRDGRHRRAVRATPFETRRGCHYRQNKADLERRGEREHGTHVSLEISS